MGTPKEWAIALVEELRKHANRDGCYGCKELLRQMAKSYGINEEKFMKGEG